MGFFSRKSKAQASIQIKGFPGHIDTCKCLYLAAEKGVNIEVDLLDLTRSEQQQNSYHTLSPFEKIPCLVEGETVIPGVASILPFIDIKGSGQSLTPRKAARLGEQNYWIEVGMNQLMPHVSTLLEEHVLKNMTDADYVPDQDKIDIATRAIETALDAVDRQLDGNQYIADDYTFADVHWISYIHFCGITGHSDLVDKRSNLKAWFERIRNRKNGNVNSYNVMPSLEQIKGKVLKNVA